MTDGILVVGIILVVWVMADGMSWSTEKKVVGPIGYFCNKHHKEKTKHTLPKEMRDLSADQLATLYTDKKLYSVYAAYKGNHRRAPQVLEDALILRRAIDALDKADKEAEEAS